MTIEQMHFNIRLLASETDGRYFSPEQIDSAINIAVLDLYNVQYKMYEESQRITDTLGVFKVVAVQPVVAGVAQIPPDLTYVTSLLATKINNLPALKKITQATDNFINNILDSEAFAPNEDDIYAQRVISTMMVYPISVTEITIAYLRLPIPGKFNYTIAPNGYSYIFDPTGSVDLDYPDQAHNEIVYKALRKLGVIQHDQVLMQDDQLEKVNNQPERR